MKQIKMGAICYAQMCAAMIPGDMTCQELAEETGLHIVTVYQYCRELHRFGAAHISRYLPDARGRHLIKVYKLGQGKDAPRKKLTHAQRQQRMRDKRKALNDPLLRLAA
jgi:DNA-binding IclR family transcriptional regulator